ncbi:MAG: lantibiotic dehydratase [Candidatus Rhabdochlamydia sp.]
MLHPREFIFTPASFFLVRTPLFPMEEFFNLLEAPDIESYLLNLFQTRSELREAIAVASFSLYETILQLLSNNKKDAKKREKAISSLFKYVLRTTTRATPFGLFSFVSMGTWSQTPTAQFDLTLIKKQARPDMEWLLHELDSILLDPSVLSFFPIKRNPFLYESMGRIVLPFSRKTRHKQVSIRTNRLVSLILFLTKEIITQKELLQKVLFHLPALSPEKVSQVIYSLIQQEILYPALLPTLLTASSFIDSIDYLKAILPSSALLVKFQTILTLLQNYHTTAVGEGENSLKILQESMKTNPSSSMLQVDAVSSEKISLHPDISHALSEGVEALWKISAMNKGIPALRSYHEKFLDKYGISRLVPVLELLDETIGLGVPEQYLVASKDKPKEPAYEAWLMEEWAHCIREHRTEIVLTEDFIKKFDLNLDPKEAPSSFDVFFGVIPQPSIENKEDFLLLLHGISDNTNGCATLGRFIDFFGKQEKEKVRSFLQEEENADSMAIYAEISYFPLSPRSANVASHSLLRSLAIDLGYSKSQEHSLDLEDIVVGATPHHLYLATKKEKQKLMVFANNVLNLSVAPTLVRFLRDVSRDSFRPFSFFSWGKAASFSFLPSIRYKKTILFPAKWQLTLSLIEAKAEDNLETLIQKIEIWANAWKLPRFLLMAWADHQILLDRTKHFHLKEIAIRLKLDPKTPVNLIEKKGEKELVKSNLGTHRCEFVVPFLKNKKHFTPLIIPAVLSSIDPAIRKKPPGGEWFYAKIYLPNNNEERFLTSCLRLFTEGIRSIIEKWFFIRFKEAGASHIRFRCKLKELKDLSSLLSAFHLWTENLLQKNWIREVQIGTYDREIERYGGLSLIDLAETFFQADSECAFSLLSLLLSKKTQFPNYIVVSLSLIHLLKSFGLSFEQQKTLFNQMNFKKELLEGFREWKSKIVFVINTLNQKPSSVSNEEQNLFSEIFQKRELQQSSYIIALQESTHLENILISLMHMNCNRILGIDFLLEQKAYVYASHAVSVFLLQNQNKGELIHAK